MRAIVAVALASVLAWTAGALGQEEGEREPSRAPDSGVRPLQTERRAVQRQLERWRREKTAARHRYPGPLLDEAIRSAERLADGLQSALTALDAGDDARSRAALDRNAALRTNYEHFAQRLETQRRLRFYEVMARRAEEDPDLAARAQTAAELLRQRAEIEERLQELDAQLIELEKDLPGSADEGEGPRQRRPLRDREEGPPRDPDRIIMG